MIKISSGLKKNFGGQEIFDDLSFNVNRGEKIGLVGRNGHGKSTLFQMIIGNVEIGKGTISAPKNYRIGYLEQHLHFTQPTVLEECSLGLPEGEEYETWKVEKILYGLGFSGEDMNRKPAEFSGGYQIRINLARLLVSNPEMLLLDEPNNYLDMQSCDSFIEAIEDFIFSGTCVFQQTAQLF